MRILSFFVFFIIAACGSSQEPNRDLPQIYDLPKKQNGQILFAEKCGTCHGEYKPTKGWKSENEIRVALALVGAMKNVVVNDTEIKAIAQYLDGLADCSGPAMPQAQPVPVPR